MWEAVVELVRFAIVSIAQAFGGSVGTAVLLVSFGLRLALLPLTLRVARQARAQQERLAALKPQVERLRKRHAQDPSVLWRETQDLYRANEIRFFTPIGFFALLLQMPLFAALFSATRRGLGTKVRFLWVAELARPDAILTLVVSVLTAAVMSSAVATSSNSSAPGNAALGLVVVVGVATLVFLWSASSAVALSVGAGSAASALQNWLLKRSQQKQTLVGAI
jgi:YidC/Oxa1 family membrane protein insertase